MAAIARRASIPRVRISALVAALLCGLVFASGAAARPLLGVLGNPARFEQQTGQHSTVVEKIVGWGQGDTWGGSFADLFGTMGDVPLLGLTMGPKPPSRGEAIDPLRVANGAGDAYLTSLNAAVSAWGRRIYVRPFFESDGFWTTYCAYTRDGRSKGPHYSTAAFRKAFARTYLILHGGPVTRIDAALLRLGMPPLAGGDLPANPAPRLKVIWSPQAYATPEIAANQPDRYYPTRDSRS